MAAYLPATEDPSLAEEAAVQRQEERVDAVLKEVEKTGFKQQTHAATLSSSTDLLASLGLEAVGVGREVVRPPSSDTVSVSAAISSPEISLEASQQVSAAQEGMLENEPAGDAAIQQEIDLFIQLYHDAQLTNAIKELAIFCAARGVSEEVMAQRLKELQGLDLEALKQRAAVVAQGIAECENDVGWTLIQDDGLRLLYRHEHGSSVHCFKGSCLLPCPLKQPLAMAREFDLVKTWNRYITASDILQTSCDVDILAYASVWLPWPMSERDVCIQAVGLDRLKEDGLVAVGFSSPDGDLLPEGVPTPAGYDARVHFSFIPGSCMIMMPVKPEVPGNPERTKVIVTALIETHISYLPEAMIHFILRVFAPFFYSSVLKTLASCFRDGQDLGKRLAERPQLYKRMEERVRDYLDGTLDAESS